MAIIDEKLNGGDTIGDFGTKYNNALDELDGVDIGPNPNTFLQVNGAGTGWNHVAGVVATPAGPDMAIQYNNGGVMAGVSTMAISMVGVQHMEVQRLEVLTPPTPNDDSTNLPMLTWVAGAANFREIVDSAWTDLTPLLVNGFVAGSITPEYRKNKLGRVEFRGRIRVNTGTFGVTMFTMPAGVRPGVNREYLIQAALPAAVGSTTMLFNTTGTVVHFAPTLAANDQIDLSAITYPIDN